MIRFKLDGTVVTNPDGWEDVVSKVKRDDIYNAVLIYQESEVEFTLDGYDYLYNKLLDGYCNIIDVTMEQSCDDGQGYVPLFVGKIFISDCEFNERTGKAKAKLEDNSFFSMIKNNQKIKTALNADVTKNNQTLFPAVVYEVDVYDIGTNASVVRNNMPTLRVYEVFKYLISFMSDNRIGFASDLFNVGGKYEGLCTAMGATIRTGAASVWQPVSFQDFFKEVYAATEPLMMILENPYTNPVIRIEDVNYTYVNSVSVICNNVYEINTSVNTAKLYTSIQLGSSLTDDTFSLSFPEDINYFGFKQEEIYIIGECNVDNSLDIVGNFCRSSNTIERQLNDQIYDDKYFLIDTELSSSTSGRTTNTNTFDEVPALYYYNDRLRNSQIMSRWSGGLPNAIKQSLGPQGNGLFKAYSAAPQSIVLLAVPSQFTNVAFNTGSFYDGTDTFTAGISSIYYFKFEGTITFSFTGPGQNTAAYPIAVVRDSASNFKYQVADSLIYFSSSQNVKTVKREFRLTLSAGDQVTLNWITPSVLLDIDAGASWECYQNTIGGGVYETFSPRDYPVLLYDFECPIDKASFDTIVSNPIARIAFNTDGQAFRYGWIKDLTYNHVKKTATFKLFAKQSNAS